MIRYIVYLGSLGAVLFLSGCVCASRSHVYLTWQGDTGTTMTVNYHTPTPLEVSAVRYGVSPDTLNLRATGSAHQIPGLKDGRYIHQVELTGLDPGSLYYFQIEHALEKNGLPRTFKFRTIPNDDSPLRFVTGGDMDRFLWSCRLLRQAAAFDPQFALIGGDLAYANGELDNFREWDAWLAHWEELLVTSEGCLVPMVLAIGNHEVNDLEDDPEMRAPFYFGFFPQGGRSYFTRTFGTQVALFVLDSGHIVSHEDQVPWLQAELEAHEDWPIKFAVYHVPFYPSHRDFDYGRSAAGRTYWQPLFDAFQLEAAFENHDHTHKRTKRIANGEVDPNGTLYLGDGCMGQFPRTVPNKDAWYMETATSTRHFWVVDIDTEGVAYRAVNMRGEVFDQSPEE